MSATTIRDVVIKVSLENGNMKLGPVDTSSLLQSIREIHAEFARSMNSLKFGIVDSASAAKQVHEEMQEALGKLKIDAIDVSAAQIAAKDVQDSFHAVSNEIQSSIQAAMQATVKIGMPGYGQSVRDRASKAADFSMNQMKQAGMTEGASDEDLQKTHEKLAKKAEAAIREQDREAANAERAYDKEVEAAKTSYSKIIAERNRAATTAQKDAEKAAADAERAYDKEAQDAIRSYSKIMAERASAAAAAQKESEKAAANAERAYDKEASAAIRSYSRIMAERKKAADAAEREYDREAQDAVRSYSKIMAERKKAREQEEQASKHHAEEQSAARYQMMSGGGRALRGGAMVAGAVGGDSQAMAQTVVAAHGLHDVFKGVMAVGAGAGLAISGPFIAATSAITASVAALGVWYLHFQETLTMARTKADAEVAKAHAGAQYATNTANSRFSHGMESAGLEGMMASTKRNATNIPENLAFQKKQEEIIRKEESRSDYTSGQKQTWRTRAEQTSAHYESTSSFNSFLLGAVAKRGKLRSVEKQIQADAKLKEQAYTNKVESLTFAKTQAERNPDRGGMGRSTDQQKYIEGFKPRFKQAELEYQAGKKDSTKQLVQNRAEQLELENQILQRLGAQNKTIREYQQDAYKVVQQEKERTKQHEIGLGASDFGTINRRKILQEKHNRIASQQKKNKELGRDENAGIDSYTQEELSLLIGSGDEAEISAEAQARRTSRQSGIKRRGHENEAEAESEYASREKLGKQNEQKNNESIESSGNNIENISNKLGTAMKESLQIDIVVDATLQALDKLKAEFEVAVIKMNNWTPTR